MAKIAYRVLEGPKVKLTNTERKIVLAYLEKRRRAKDIAQALGVSPRTVYKALYKYRLNLKALGLTLDAVSENAESVSNRKTEKSLLLDSRATESIFLKEALMEEIRKVVKETLSSMFGIYPYQQNLQFIHDKVLIEALNKLEQKIEKLSQSIEKLTITISNMDTGDKMEKASIEDGDFTESIVPSFVQGNPWLTVLRSRGKET